MAPIRSRGGSVSYDAESGIKPELNDGRCSPLFSPLTRQSTPPRATEPSRLPGTDPSISIRRVRPPVKRAPPNPLRIPAKHASGSVQRQNTTQNDTSPVRAVPSSSRIERPPRQIETLKRHMLEARASRQIAPRALVSRSDSEQEPVAAGASHGAPRPLVSRSEQERVLLQQALDDGNRDRVLSCLEKIAWSVNLLHEIPEIRRSGLYRTVERIGEMSGQGVDGEVRTAAKRLVARWKHGVYTNNPYQRWPENRRPCKEFVVGEVFADRQQLFNSGIHLRKKWGVSGTQKYGAQAIVIAESPYDDIDSGNELWYSGVISKDKDGDPKDEMAFSTKVLDKSFERTRMGDRECAIKVIRASNCEWGGRPQMGFRYDGLYYIDDKQPLDGETAGPNDYTFHLVRAPGQEEIQSTPGGRERTRLMQV